MTKVLPSRYEIVEPTLALVESIDTKASYDKYKDKKGRLNRGLLIQIANPSLSLKQAQNRGNRIYGSLQPAIDAKSEEALEKQWVPRLCKQSPLKYEDTNIGELIEQTCKKYSTQGEIATYECQLRIHLENTHISKEDICKINDDFNNLMKDQPQRELTAWRVVNLYWAMYTNNNRYIGIHVNHIYSSLEEVIFGNYLYLSEIPFEAHCYLKTINRVADFKLSDFDAYIEILMCDPNDPRACSQTSKRIHYSKRTKMKEQEYEANNINVKFINGDVSDITFYQGNKTLINEFYPTHIPPEFELVRQYNKDNLAYLLKLTIEEVHKLIDNTGGRSNFKNNKHAEYQFLTNNYPNFGKIWGDAKARWQIKRSYNIANTRRKNGNFMTVLEHIEAIWQSNLHKALGNGLWKCKRQDLYWSWVTYYNTYKDIFAGLGITPPPDRFKKTFYVKAGSDSKNLKFYNFINADKTQLMF